MLRARAPIRGKIIEGKRTPLNNISGQRIPRTDLLFYARYPGLVDTIGLSIAVVYPQVDPALRSIISADGGTTWRDGAEIVTLALASPLLNAEGLIGSAEWGIVMYASSATEATLTRARRVVGVSKSVLITFTEINYNAAWTPPTITGTLLSDANVVWVNPSGSTFTGKAPAMTNFSATGKYRCKVDLTKVTAFSFFPGTNQNWLSTMNIVEFLPLMTGLLSFVVRSITSLTTDITSLVLPSSMTSLDRFFQACGVTGNISNLVVPPSVVSFMSFLSSASSITGTIPYLLRTTCNVYQFIGYNTTTLNADLSTWVWKINIVNVEFPNTRFTYGTGGSLRINVKNGLIFSLDNCALPAVDVGRVLIDINMSGATGVGGTISLNNNNAAPDWGTEAEPSDVAYAVADLIFKNWSSIAVTGGIPAWVLAL